MPLLSLLAALAAASPLQISYGQQINEGNNLITLTSHNLAAIQQQSQIKNVTDIASLSSLEQNLSLKTGKDFNLTNFNNSVTYPSGGTIRNIKFVRNPAYEGPTPSFSVINSNNAPDTISFNHDLMSFNLPSASLSGVPSNTATVQVASKTTENKAGSSSKSPLFISLAPRFSGGVPLHNSYFISTLPKQSSLPNMATLQPSTSPPLQQPTHQAFSSVQCQQPSNGCTPTNMRLRFVPASTTGPLQNTIPIQNTIPTQNILPIQQAVPMQNTVATQNTAPVHNTIDSAIQNPQLSLLMSHLFSQCPVKQDYSTPAMIRYPSQDQNQPKQTAIKTLLPLLYQLLTDKHNNCCDYKNKRSRTNTRYKQGTKQAYDKVFANSLELCTKPGTSEHFHRNNKNKGFTKPYEHQVDEEDYSNESLDYTAEDYDDED